VVAKKKSAKKPIKKQTKTKEKKLIKKQTKTKEKKPIEIAKPSIEPQAQPTIVPQEPEKPPTTTFSSNKKNPMKINPLFIIIGVSIVAAGISVSLFVVMSENAEQQLLLIEQERVKIQQQKDLEIKQLELEAQEIARRQQELEAEKKELQLQEEMRQQDQAAKKKQLQLQGEMRQQELAAEKQEHELQKTIRLDREEAERQEQRQQAEIARQETLRQQEQEVYEAEIKQEEKNQIIILAQTNPVLRGLIDGTMYFYIEPIPSYYKVSGINSAVDDIAESLTRNFYGVDIRRTYDSSFADLTISWIKNYGTHVLGESIFKSVIKVGLGRDNCNGEWQAFDTTSIKKVMWHEIGHSLGYGHSSDPNNVMYYQTSTQFAKDKEFSYSLERNHWRWIYFCGSGEQYYYVSSNSEEDGFDVYVLPPETDPNTFVSEGGSRYTNCGAERKLWFSHTCSIASGSKLMIHNYEDYTIKITGHMIDENSNKWPEMTWDYNVFQYDTSYMNYVRNLFH